MSLADLGGKKSAKTPKYSKAAGKKRHSLCEVSATKESETMILKKIEKEQVEFIGKRNAGQIFDRKERALLI